ncbi:MAG: M48 family metallopeptidase [Paludibacteraceae bacterium]|nr:M48 family metallopeptidase [Paludibacteraceae bacterium]
MLPEDFIHPEDAKALKALRAIPGLSALVKAFMNIGWEQQRTGLNLATKVRLSPTQLPHLYNLLPPICEKLQIQEPAFFLELNPFPNAEAFGDTQVNITINSGLVDMATEDELRAVIAHECGHIACHHMLYHSIASMIIHYSERASALLNFISEPLKYALCYWERKSELSCDRAAAYAVGPQATASMLSRLAGGPKAITKDLNLEELAAQADEYDALCKAGLWNKTLQTLAVLNEDHPYVSVRLREMLLWSKSEAYKRLTQEPVAGKTCLRCHQPVESDWRFCQHCGQQLQ